MRIFVVIASALLISMSINHADADPVIFSHSGTGSGSIGGVTFSSAEFRITAHADTSNVQNDAFNTGLYINHDFSSIHIAGVGEFNFVSGTRTFVNNISGDVGFSRATIPGKIVSGVDLFNGPLGSDDFYSWDMLSSINKSANNGELFYWESNIFVPALSPVITSGGVLVFNDETDIAVTFSAVVVPTPSSAILLVILVGMKRRR